MVTPHRNRKRLVTVVAAVLCTLGPAMGGGGVGELTLDRQAVTSLLRAGLPDAIPLELPGFGTVRLELSSPSEVEFVGGGIEIPVGFAVPDVGLAGRLRVRYVPRIDRVEGFVGLSAESATAEAPVRLPIDLSQFLPDVELPPELAWSGDGEAGQSWTVVVQPQGVRIDGDRMTITFGLAARREKS